VSDLYSFYIVSQKGGPLFFSHSVIHQKPLKTLPFLYPFRDLSYTLRHLEQEEVDF